MLNFFGYTVMRLYGYTVVRLYGLLLIAFVLAMPLSAQNRGKATAPAKRTTATRSTAQKKQGTAKKSTAPQGKKGAQKKQTKPVDRKAQLRNEHAATEAARRQSQAQLAQLNRNVKSNLDSVLILDHQIGRQQESIDSLNHDILTLGATIDTLQSQLGRLQLDLEVKKRRYAKAMVYMRKNRSVQNKLMFIFSAENFTQMVRRMRYVREYSTFQRAQGELLKEKQAEVRAKQNELLAAKTQKQQNLHTVEQKQRSLQGMKASCQTKVEFLNRNIATVQQQIQEYQRKEQAINAEIERIIQEEIAAARRAEAERKRREEEARRRAEAERARRLAEAKAQAERARRAAEAAEAARRNARTAKEKESAQAATERARADVRTAEANVRTAAREEKTERAKTETWVSNNAADAKLSSNFVSNKGRLPMPITGSYSVVGHYGNYTVAGLRNVTLDNKGIDIRGQQGCAARAVFDGTVSSVFQYGGTYIVMLRHGTYISVYSGLSSVSVRKGQTVSTRTTLGAVGQDADGRYVLHFQLRNGNARLNPEQWVR